MSKRTLLTALSFLAFISLGLPDGLLGVSWPSISFEFALPLDRLGVLVAVTTVGYLTASFNSGAALRLFPIGTILAVSTLAKSVGMLGFAMTPSWTLMVAMGFVAGLGAGSVDAGLNSYGARHFRPKTLIWLHAFFGLGTTIGPIIVTIVLGSGFGWQWSYLIVGSAQMALGFTFFVMRRRWDEVAEIGHAEETDTQMAPSIETLRLPVVWLGMLVFFFYSGVEIAAAQWSYSLLRLGRGLSEATAGAVITLYWASLMVGRVGFGFIADRVPLVKALRICLLGSVMGALLFWLDLSPTASVVGLMFMGLCFAPVFASLISLTPTRVGRRHANSAIGYQIAASGLGGAVLTASIGLLTRSFGLEVIGSSISIATVLLFILFLGFTSRTTST